jgi:hypothetical protein
MNTTITRFLLFGSAAFLVAAANLGLRSKDFTGRPAAVIDRLGIGALCRRTGAVQLRIASRNDSDVRHAPPCLQLDSSEVTATDQGAR